MGISVVVLSYNHPEITARCLSSLLNSQLNSQPHAQLSPQTAAATPISIILVHNGSLAQHRKTLEDKFPTATTGVRHLILERNLGFSGGANAGLRAALSESQWCLFLSNDTRIENFGGPPNEPGLWAPLIWKRETLQMDSCGAEIDFRHARLTHTRTQPLQAIKLNAKLKAWRRPYIPGAAFWIDRQTFFSAQGFDTQLGSYWEDVDLSLRILNAGGTLGLWPATRIRHGIGKTCHKDPHYTSYLYQRNRLWTLRRHSPLASVSLGVATLEAASLATRFARQRKWSSLQLLSRGYFEGMLARYSRSNLIAVLLCVSFLSVTARAALPPALSSLQPMIQSLCTRSPEIVDLNESLIVAQQQEQVSSRYLIPKITLASSVGLMPAGTGSPSGASGTAGLLGVSADLGLNPLFGPALQLRKARLNLQGRQISRLQGLQIQIADFLDQILNLSLLKARERDLEETQKRLEKQYRIAQTIVRQGIGKRRDQQRFETELLRLRENRLGVERSRIETEQKLSVLLATQAGAYAPLSWDLAWPEFNKILIPNPEAATASPALQIARLKYESSIVDYELTREGTGFTTSLQGQYTYQNSTLAPAWSSASLRNPWNTNWSLMLNFSYPLWDNGADSLARRDALRGKTVAQVELEKAEREFVSTLELFADQRRRVEERRLLADKLYALEKTTFAQVATDYREGRLGYLEWLNSSQSLQSAVSSQIESAVEWARLWIRSAQLKGELAHDFCDLKTE